MTKSLKIVFFFFFVQIVGQALVITLEVLLGDKFTNDVKEAYISFFGILTMYMKEGLKSPSY